MGVAPLQWLGCQWVQVAAAVVVVVFPYYCYSYCCRSKAISVCLPPMLVWVWKMGGDEKLSTRFDSVWFSSIRFSLSCYVKGLSESLETLPFVVDVVVVVVVAAFVSWRWLSWLCICCHFLNVSVNQSSRILKERKHKRRANFSQANKALLF